MMRLALASVAVGVCTLTAGCRLAVNVARNLAYEPMRYADDSLECLRNGALAREAWSRVSGEATESFSGDYARGFKDGYADYLHSRGTGAPPPVPPKCYWNAHYQTPSGHRAIEDWYAGFQHGVATARENLHAPFLTVPTTNEGVDLPRYRLPILERIPAAQLPLPRPADELVPEVPPPDLPSPKGGPPEALPLPPTSPGRAK